MQKKPVWGVITPGEALMAQARMLEQANSSGCLLAPLKRDLSH